jgi:hypothetical protein
MAFFGRPHPFFPNADWPTRHSPARTGIRPRVKVPGCLISESGPHGWVPEPYGVCIGSPDSGVHEIAMDAGLAASLN